MISGLNCFHLAAGLGCIYGLICRRFFSGRYLGFCDLNFAMVQPPPSVPERTFRSKNALSLLANTHNSEYWIREILVRARCQKTLDLPYTFHFNSHDGIILMKTTDGTRQIHRTVLWSYSLAENQPVSLKP